MNSIIYGEVMSEKNNKYLFITFIISIVLSLVVITGCFHTNPKSEVDKTETQEKSQIKKDEMDAPKLFSDLDISIPEGRILKANAKDFIGYVDKPTKANMSIESEKSLDDAGDEEIVLDKPKTSKKDSHHIF